MNKIYPLVKYLLSRLWFGLALFNLSMLRILTPKHGPPSFTGANPNKRTKLRKWPGFKECTSHREQG